jgi:hypothetical protein
LDCALTGLLPVLPSAQVFERIYPSVQDFDHLRERPDHCAVDVLGWDLFGGQLTA